MRPVLIKPDVRPDSWLSHSGATRFPALYGLLTGGAPSHADPLAPLSASLAEQVKRGGRGSEIAAAKLEGLLCGELRGAR